VKLNLTLTTLILALTLPAAAQEYVDRQVRFDNNPQVGSGGINTPVQTPDFASRNRVITGEAAGFGYFRDDVGFRAPGEFRGNLESDSLFRFRAQSAPTAGSLNNLSGRAAVQRDRFAPNPTLSRGFDGRSLQTVRRVPRSEALLQNNDGTYRAYSPPPRFEDSDAYITPDRIGTIVQPDGRLMEVSASPLGGLRQRVHEPGVPAFQQRFSDEPLDAQGEDEAESRTNTMALDSGRFRPEDAQVGTTRGLLTDTQLTPTLELGAQLQGRIEPLRIGGHQMSAEQRVEQIEAQYNAALGTRQVEPGQDVYMNVLQEVRQRAQRVRGRTAGEQLEGETVIGGAGENDAAGDPWARPGLTKPEPLEEPTDEEMADAAEARSKAIRVALGLEEPEEGEAGDQADEAGEAAADADGDDPAEDADADADETEVASAAAEQMLEVLDHDLPPVADLAGQSEALFDRILKQGQSAMARGDYFDAADEFRRASRINAANPTPKVGLVHAQMGAGMIRSAAVNLRELFTKHPEMVAVRYDAKLLPNGDRLDWLKDELSEALNDRDRQDPALLMAYIGYQTDSAKLMRYGLDLAQARAPRDPLVTVLRRIWLKPKRAPSSR